LNDQQSLLAIERLAGDAGYRTTSIHCWLFNDQQSLLAIERRAITAGD